jgi:hypothetical protein
MRKMATFAALVLALAAGLVTAQSGQSPVLVQYANVAPSGTCLPGYGWVNVTDDSFWLCDPSTNPPSWFQTGGGSATFPITATSGATTVTLTGNPVAQTGAYSLSNATEGAGWNAALAGALGSSLFAFNATETGSISVDLTANQILLAYLAGDDEVKLELGPNSQAYSYEDATSRQGGWNFSPGVAALAVDGPGTSGPSVSASLSASVVAETVSLSYQQSAQDVRVELVQQGIRLRTDGVKPTCGDVGTRGALWFVEGGAGVADTFEACMKNAADVYAWVALATP